MEQICTLFKNNLKLITPSFCLCVDETLYSFRGHCFFRQYIPTILVYSLNTGVWLTQERVIKKQIVFNSLLFMILGYYVDVDIYLG
jgi:hypothetical protein